ncbi:MAG: ParB/RepB/Spo0J family partition protein, partial [bacterium]|nr:ParB/RepB/Spo0J family partition protein [bacterium]
GLDALIPRSTHTVPLSTVSPKSRNVDDHGGDNDNGLLEVPIDAIKANRFQPRTEFDKEALADLASSIKEYGVLQPLIVEEVKGQYHLIAGERRLRASKIAGLHTVPVIVRDADDHQRLALAIIENIQRVNLNPIETAFAYQRLIDDFNLTQDQVAKKMGRSRASVANTLRLLHLHSEIQVALSRGDITEGHGKLLAGIDNTAKQFEVFKHIIDNTLSVGDTAHHVRPHRKKSAVPKAVDPNIAEKERRLREQFGTKVRIQHKQGKGSISIDFYSDEEFRSLLSQLLDD